MGAKLIKHEALRTGPALGVLMGGAAGLVVLGTAISRFELMGISTLGYIAAILASVALVPVAQFYLAVDFYRSSFGRTGYFTQTLPISGGKIFRWKLVWGAAVSVVTGVVSAGLILYQLRYAAGAAMWPQVRTFLNQVREQMPWWVAAAGVVMIIVILIANLAYFYFAATAGAAEPLNRHGVAGPIVVGVIGYLAQQVLFLVAIIAIPLGLEISSGGLSFNKVNWLNEIMTNSNPSGIPLGFVAVYPIVIVVMVWWTHTIWRKRISLV